MTTIDTPTTVPTAATQTISPEALALVTFDLYRDVHKGIRAELFALTASAGSIDPNDRYARLALADHVTSTIALLDSHATHEDEHLEPVLRVQRPDLAVRVADDHRLLEAHLARIGDLAVTSVDASSGEQRRSIHHLYLELSAFTSAYLAHQLLEETAVMPALEQAVGVEALSVIHGAILSSIPPAEMAQSLALMIPAMNLDDRVEMLTGMRMTAPPEAFDGVVDIARSTLDPVDFAALAARLSLN